MNVQTDDSDIESNYMNITFNEAIEISGMKNEKPDTFILSNTSIGWKASKGSGSWTANDVTMKLMTRVDPVDLGLNATRYQNYMMQCFVSDPYWESKNYG